MRLYLVMVSFFSIALYAADDAYFFAPQEGTKCYRHMHGCEVFKQRNARLIWAVAAQDEAVGKHIVQQIKDAYNEVLQQDEVVVPSLKAACSNGLPVEVLKSGYNDVLQEKDPYNKTLQKDEIVVHSLKAADSDVLHVEI